MSDDLDFTVSRIIITRGFLDDVDAFTVEAVSPDGEELPLIESLGLIELAKAHLIAPLVNATEEDD